ncbi:MAG TPA: LptF/LptG family permease, partial [Opitutaceae bacterium]|nr:LptF/LptG family permease [Opitutaceae bacterium]
GVNTFDRHVLREWLKILGLVLVASLGLMLMQVMYDNFRDLRDLGAKPADMAAYFFVTVPSFFAVVLPLALLVSLLFALGQLHRHMEFTPMRVAGMGLFRLTRPIWMVGLLCCGLSWWLNANIIPWSVEQSRGIFEDLQFRKEAKSAVSDHIGAVYDMAFDNQGARRMWFFNRYSRFTQHGYGVSVSELNRQRRETRRLLAGEAWFDASQKAWVFRHGRELVFDLESGVPVSSMPFDEKREYRYDEDPKLMLLVDQRPEDLSFFELRRVMEYYQAEDNTKGIAYAVRYFGLLANTLGPLIVIGIAVPFAMSGVRVNPAVGVSKSIGLFLLYYLLSSFAASLATKQLVTPELAAWLPNLGMAALAAWLFGRLR